MSKLKALFKKFLEPLKPTVKTSYYFNSKKVSEKEWQKMVQDDWDRMEEHFDNIAKRMKL